MCYTRCHITMRRSLITSCFFSNDTATTEIYTLSLHDALPISQSLVSTRRQYRKTRSGDQLIEIIADKLISASDRKSTRLNSSHVAISYAVFCLKKKKENGELH